MKSEKCLVLRIQLQPHVHHPPQDPMEITRVQTLYPKIKIIQGRSNTYQKNDRYCKMIPMNQMKRTLIEKILTVCRIPIQKETLKTNRESSSRKNNSKLKKKQQRNPKIRTSNYVKRWLYLQKKQKRFSNQTNQKKKKTIFISNLCQKSLIK